MLGSRFHAIRQTRGQQGIGITGVVMYAQLTTGAKTRVISKIAKEVQESIAKYQIENVLDIGYVSHKEVTTYQQKTQVLLLCVNNVKSAKGIITGKIFEYLQAKRPILAIGPINGDLAAILHETNSGTIVNFDAVENLKNELLQLYDLYKLNELKSNSNTIEKYHRRNLTQKLANIIKETVS